MTDATSTSATTELPEWDLGDLYPGRESAELKADLAAAEAAADDFFGAYHGRVAALDGAGLGAAIAAYEAQQDRLGRLMAYASLSFAGDMTSAELGAFYQAVQERVARITSKLVFFTLEINRLSEAEMAARLADPACGRYGAWLRDTRVFAPYQLSEDLEKLLNEKAVAGRSAWIRLFDETMARLRFPLADRELSTEEVLHLLSDKDGEVRRQAAGAISDVLGQNIRLFAFITNTLAKDKDTDDRWRGLPAPETSRHLANQVEPEVAAALVGAVRDAYPRLSHRYYALKARWLGREKLDHWDRNAPLPDDDDREIPWAQARDIVLAAYGRFSPELAALGRRFFENAWIDAAHRPGKAGGAFAHPTVPSAHPYLLLNYLGRTRDVMTLAHELGHGVHQILAGGQGALQAETPLTLAETASVFGEMLTFQSLLAAADNPNRRRILLANKVEDMLNTVVRQTAFYTFEQRVHGERKQGELGPDRLAEIWLDVQRESLGPAFRLDDGYGVYWSYIPHFIHSPFYVYAYAFGDCLVNALYAVYQDSEAGFQDRYLDLLRAGGTLRHRELLAPFGLDAGDPAFWSKGLDLIAGFIDELEAG